MLLSYLAISAYLISTALLMQYFTQQTSPHQYKKITALLIAFAIITQAINFTHLYQANGIIFGLANSASFVAWLISVLLFLSSISKPVHALGILVYPLTAFILLLGLALPDTQDKIIPLNIASHVVLSIVAYALLALAVCQSILLKIQENYLHKHRINSFISKLAPLQTMEDLLFQSIRIGFYLLTLSLISGFIFIDDFFAQHLVHKTVLSLVAWTIFAVLILGRKLFGWRGKQTIIATQIGFLILVLGYFGSKFVLERLLS